MEAGDTRVADLVNTVHHEIASTFCNHHVDKGFLDRHPHSVRNLNVIRDIILHEGALSSTVRHLSYYWDKEERKKIRSIM